MCVGVLGASGEFSLPWPWACRAFLFFQPCRVQSGFWGFFAPHGPSKNGFPRGGYAKSCLNKYIIQAQN